MRGYKLVEDGAVKVADTATGIYQDAVRRADEAEPRRPTTRPLRRRPTPASR